MKPIITNGCSPIGEPFFPSAIWENRVLPTKAVSSQRSYSNSRRHRVERSIGEFQVLGQHLALMVLVRDIPQMKVLGRTPALCRQTPANTVVDDDLHPQHTIPFVIHLKRGSLPKCSLNSVKSCVSGEERLRISWSNARRVGTRPRIGWGL
jgi:hypothetical protein